MIVATNPTAELSEFYPPPYGFLRPRAVGREKGMGAATQAVQQGISLATTGTAIGATIAGAAGIASIAGPIGTIAGVLAGILMNAFHGCGQSCTLASDAANQIEQALQQNVNAYFASARTVADQQAALQNFDSTWAQLVQYCGQASLGTAGQNCIKDRQAGSCAYKTSGCSLSSSTPPVWGCGANGSGSECWNWFIGYRDPIANDTPNPNPVASNPVSSAVAGLFPSLDLSSLWLPGALVLGGLLLFAGGD